MAEEAKLIDAQLKEEQRAATARDHQRMRIETSRVLRAEAHALMSMSNTSAC